ADAKRIELTFEVSPDVPDLILTDSLRLRQVILNLLSNALKFTKDGEVSLRVKLLSRIDNDLEIYIEVEDTGIGIPGDRLDCIFEAFTQADCSTTRNFGGTGLGLTIAASLVELMGGRLAVESEVGRGSIFSFTVACQEAAEQDVSSVMPAGTESLLGMHVLIVDDNHTNLRILKAILDSVGARCVTAASGQEAIGYLDTLSSSSEVLDLIITDAHMPEMDGFMLAEKIKNNPTFCGQQIMMLSSSNLKGDLERCRKLGIASHMTKPVSRNELFSAILSQLPNRSKTSRTAKPTIANRVAPRRGLRILLAEDNHVNQMVASAYLQKLGVELSIADDGQIAVDMVAQGSFDIILMDVQMPNMDGLEATRILREKGVKTPIVALTAHALKGDAERCLQTGMDAYVSKPIDETILRETIEKLAEDLPWQELAEEVLPRPSVLEVPSTEESEEDTVKVLIIDDSSNYRKVLSRALTAPGIQVIGSASDGRSGLEAVEKLQPDVITLDIDMPTMDGIETLREIRARRLTTGVVIVSTKATRVTREALDLGVDRIVMKPDSGKSYHENIEFLSTELVSRVLELGRLKQHRAAPRTVGPFKVLVLDDSRFQRRQVCRYFKSRGIEAVEAESVTEAVEQLDSMSGADLLMVDLFLPEQDGLAMIRELRKRPEHMNGRIVIMSSENRQDEIIRCVESGADEYLMKPFDGETLFAKLRLVFGPSHPAFGEVDCA
ncbi:MAG: response regulator, partial [Candidatus Eremiobacteraeota bacterium]|nr:response regulator [Candidatus Eremiobacteraeota bacterium]